MTHMLPGALRILRGRAGGGGFLKESPADPAFLGLPLAFFACMATIGVDQVWLLLACLLACCLLAACLLAVAAHLLLLLGDRRPGLPGLGSRGALLGLLRLHGCG